MIRPVRLAGLLAIVALVLAPAAAAAHPLGNFTINHYAGLRIGADRIAVDLVIDEAEIPTFQDRQRIDRDGNGDVTPDELEAERTAVCPRLAADLRLDVGGSPLALKAIAAGLSFPPGAGGLSTMRVVCELSGALGELIVRPTEVRFEDRSFAARIGWRELAVLGDGTIARAVGPVALREVTASGRLTSYPADQLAQPLDERSLAVSVAPGGAALAAWTAPDASPLSGAGSIGSTPARAPSAVGGATLAAVPGGVTEELAGLIDAGGLSPTVLLGSLLVAFGLGIAHALSPGHGKTIMAAYLVGSRGTARQAVGLGLSVTVAHTLGVLVLAVITLAAASTLPPERLYPILGAVSGGLVVMIGGSLLFQRLRALWSGRPHQNGHDRGHEHGTEHAHGPSHEHDAAHAHSHGHSHGHDHSHGAADVAQSLSWRRLFALGLSGGLVPSASALILLLGSIAAGRVAYGLVLVVTFGIGMAVVLGGVGLLLVQASRFAERLPGLTASPTFGRIWSAAQLLTAALVLGLGLVLTSQAIGQVL
jgi:nickel/cobalt exporter